MGNKCAKTEGTRNFRNDSPEDRTFRLKFLGELPDTVLTGTVLKSKENEDLKLVLHNSEGRIVERGPGSFAKVEVVVLEANDNDDENNMTSEEFESRIIKTGENKKPHFVKDVYIYLKEGVGILTGVKLGHGKGWIKKYNCRLGAKMGQNLNGVIVQEAWTPPFEVKDKRIKNNEKHDLPKLDSEVWRLVFIARNSALHKQLEGKNIKTLRDFLFWYHVNLEGLKQIVSRNWTAIETHAKKTCISDDKIFSHKSPSEPQMSVLYNAVGKLKGVINGSHFVHIDDLSADKKEDARKLLMSVLEPSAFVNRYDIFFDSEASLLQQYPRTDPQNYGGTGLSTSHLGLENHCPLISFPSEEPQWSEENHLNGGGDQINAGASENEMRKNSCRPSTTNSFQGNRGQDSGTFISITDLAEISYDATINQGWSETFFDDGASYLSEFSLTDPQNFDEATHLDPDVFGDFRGLSFEEFYHQTSLLSDIDKVTDALARAGLESLNLIVGIDFTKSNEWTGNRSFHKRSLHHIGDEPNPYEQAISITGRTLSVFDENNLIPCFGFGDASTHDQDVFSFFPDERFCEGFEQVISRYRELVPQLRLAGPTSFAPVIEMAITIVEQSGGQYHVLLIIADGPVTRSVDTDCSQLSPQEKRTVDAIVKASEYPLSIILVGVGDGPWDMRREFYYNIPARAFNNFQFINFTEIMLKNMNPSRKEAEFARSAFMELPSQYKATRELNILGASRGNSVDRVPLPPPLCGVDRLPLPPPLHRVDRVPLPPLYRVGQVLRPLPYNINLCPICLTEPKSMAFGCGHQTCCECGQYLSLCPICRKPIQTRIKLY